MSEQELEQEILDYIKTTYKAEYTGLLKVKKSGTSYMFIMGLPSYMIPTTIAYDAVDDNDFLQFIYEELRTRNYMRLDIYKVHRTNDSREE